MGLFKQYWTQWKQIKESGYFTQELSSDINYWSPTLLSILTIQLLVVFLTFVRWPTTVTAKELTSRQKENLKAKRKTSRQKEKDSRQNFFDAERTFFILFSFAMWLFFLLWSFSFCPEVFLFAMRFYFYPKSFSFYPEVFLFALRLILFPWQSAGPLYLWNSVHEDSWFFSTCGYSWELAQTLLIWLAFIILATEFMDWHVSKTLDIFVCKNGDTIIKLKFKLIKLFTINMHLKLMRLFTCGLQIHIDIKEYWVSIMYDIKYNRNNECQLIRNLNQTF